MSGKFLLMQLIYKDTTQKCLPKRVDFPPDWNVTFTANHWVMAYSAPLQSQPCITPIFKKGNHCLPYNYHPISLTSPLCKIMVSIIKGNIQEHLQANTVIPPDQHGFTPGRSCSTQLLLAINEWTYRCIIHVSWLSKGLWLSATQSLNI